MKVTIKMEEVMDTDLWRCNRDMESVGLKVTIKMEDVMDTDLWRFNRDMESVGEDVMDRLVTV